MEYETASEMSGVYLEETASVETGIEDDDIGEDTSIFLSDPLSEDEDFQAGSPEYDEDTLFDREDDGISLDDNASDVEIRHTTAAEMNSLDEGDSASYSIASDAGLVPDGMDGLITEDTVYTGLADMFEPVDAGVSQAIIEDYVPVLSAFSQSSLTAVSGGTMLQLDFAQDVPADTTLTFRPVEPQYFSYFYDSAENEIDRVFPDWADLGYTVTDGRFWNVSLGTGAADVTAAISFHGYAAENAADMDADNLLLIQDEDLYVQNLFDTADLLTVVEWKDDHSCYVYDVMDIEVEREKSGSLSRIRFVTDALENGAAAFGVLCLARGEKENEGFAMAEEGFATPEEGFATAGEGFITTEEYEDNYVVGWVSDDMDAAEENTIDGWITDAIDQDEKDTVDGWITDAIDQDEEDTVDGWITDDIDQDEKDTVDGWITDDMDQDEKDTFDGLAADAVGLLDDNEIIGWVDEGAYFNEEDENGEMASVGLNSHESQLLDDSQADFSDAGNVTSGNEEDLPALTPDPDGMNDPVKTYPDITGQEKIEDYLLDDVDAVLEAPVQKATQKAVQKDDTEKETSQEIMGTSDSIETDETEEAATEANIDLAEDTAEENLLSEDAAEAETEADDERMAVSGKETTTVSDRTADLQTESETVDDKMTDPRTETGSALERLDEYETETGFALERLDEYAAETGSALERLDEYETETETESTEDSLDVFESEAAKERLNESETETEAAEESLEEYETETEAAEESLEEYETETEAAEESLDEFETETEPESLWGSFEEYETETESVITYPAQSFAFEGEVSVYVNAPEGALPENTSMKVTPVRDDNDIANISGAVSDENTEKSIQRIEAVDIAFFSEDGDEIEPLIPVRVRIVTRQRQKNEDTVVVHVDDDGVAETIDNASIYQSGDQTHFMFESLEKEQTPEDTFADSNFEELPETAALNEKGAAEESVAFEESVVVEEPAAEEEPVFESESLQIAEFETDQFSIYAVVYTVDFHWEVDGKEFSFSIPGGGFVSLQHLVEVLGIANGDAYSGYALNEAVTNYNEDLYLSDDDDSDRNSAYEEAIHLNQAAVSEMTGKFVAEVANVEFESPDLVWAGKVDETTTVGQLKDANGLDCRYSAEMTEEQIYEINCSTVEGGDWALISVLPFTSEETLTVTMKNGDQFVIRVTDAQIKTTVLDARGDTWEITVTYDDNAQIPEGAELRVREILPEEGEYQHYYRQSLKTVGTALKQDSDIAETDSENSAVKETADENEVESESATESEVESEPEDKTSGLPVDNYTRIFDIKIWDGNDKIEPKSNVTVDIRLLNGPEKDELLPHVVHFAESGTELMELTEVSKTNEYDVQFETDEFSVYSVIYTVDLHYDAETGTLLYEDNKIKVTVSAKEKVKDVFPEEAVLIVKELIPEDSEAADLYAQALTALSDSLREQNYGFSAVKVYDFSILDKKGNEIEPNGKVSVKIEYKQKPELSDIDRNGADIQIAHLMKDPLDEERQTIEFVDAEVDATTLGTVSGAEFTTDSFSAYIVFNRDGISTQEPTDLGNYGWIRFNTVGEQDTTPNQTASADSTTILWGYYKNDGSNLPSLTRPQAYRRILKVRLWLPKTGQDSSVYDSDHYNEAATAQYFWVWQNEVNIEEFELPGYEVVHTRMHTAWDEENGKEPVENDSLVGSYNVRGYRRSTLSDEPDAKNSDLNVLDVYAKPLPQITGMNYIIRYVHADGSVTDGNVRSLASGSVRYDANQYKRAGEVYAGTSIVTGSDAIDADTANGAGTITYKSDVSLAKVYVYYKIDSDGNGNPNTKGRYDKDTNGYYTGAKGLYTDKRAETVTGNDRQFILNLESWYVDNAASVGMVLDASGSMAWTSGAPEPVILTSDQLNKRAWISNSWKYVRDYSGSYTDGQEVPDSNYIPYTLLSQIMDKNKTDNSSMGYNGYHYYLKDERSTVKEYVALGYTDGNRNSDWTRLKGSSGYDNGNGRGFATVSRWLSNENEAGGKNQGWYYVNSTGRVDRYLNHTGKSYDGYAVPTSTGSSSKGPLRFYVKNGKELWVAFYDSTNSKVVHSPVYEKRDKMFTKMETLQDAVSQFGAILLGSNPDSEIAMTRFSQDIVASNNQRFPRSSYLTLLNWTGDTIDVSAALTQSIDSYGGKTRNDDGLTVYEYGLTGQTMTYTGVQAYAEHLKGTATAANHKYLVIFTDGKDTHGDADKGKDNPPWGDTGTQIRQLKTDGYTIITVMMRSQAMTGDEYTVAKAFLQGIASPGLDGNASNTSADNKLYFEADSNSTKDVIDAFRQIANRIASGLNGYTVRDYIDPRFDVLNDAGDVLTVLDSNGQFTHETNPDIDAATGLRGFTTPDNKHAYLGYDSAKKMFYVLWKDQEIPASTIESRNVNPWKSQVRIQAKEDFLGGNDILSNGNETGLNQVYYPNATDPTGMTPITGNTNYPSKDFPKTTTNPGTLNITLSNYEDTIFLGETISPASLYDSVQVKRDSETDYRSLYFNYLVRAGQKFQDDPTYYINLLKYGTVPAGASNTNPAKDRNGNVIPDFAFISDGKGVTELTLPYYYLENPGDASSYAGGTLHQVDKVGKVTYSWKATDTGGHTLTDSNALLDYASTTLDTVRYQLSVTYVPDEAKYDSLDVNGNVVGDSSSLADNGSARTLKLTGQYGTDKLIKDPVGGPAQTQTTITDPETMGLAAIHVVAGKLKITKRIEVIEPKWTKLIGQAGDAGLTFTFQLKRDGSNYGSPISLTMKADNATRTGNYVELSSDWVTNLPLGDYTIEETSMPSGYEFVSVAADTVIDADGDGGVSGTQFIAPTEGSVTWKIGQVFGGVPALATYSATDFSADKVKDTNKEVDPDKAKPYLNAQIGKGIVLNEAPKTIDVTLKKVDVEDLSDDNASLLKGAKFTITKYTDSNFNVVDTDSPWSSTLDDEKTGDSYSLNGIFEFEDLPVGFFKIEEVRMPDGYVSFTEDPVFEVRVKTGTSDLELVLYKKNGDSYEAVNTGTTEITRIAPSDTFMVGNTPGVALPNTGGPGMNLIYFFGIMLTGLAGVGVVMKKRRRNVI